MTGLGVGLGLGDGQSTGFNALAIGTGCVCWLVPDYATMTTGGLNSPHPGTDGTEITRWLDQSGNGNMGQQVTSANKPAWYNNVQNGYGMVRFDGGNDYFTADWLATYLGGNDTPCTVGIAFKKTGNATRDAFLGAGTNPAGHNIYFYTDTAPERYLARKFDGTTTLAPSYAATLDTNAHILTIRVNGTTIDMWLEGTQIMSGSGFDVNNLVLTLGSIGGLFEGTGMVHPFFRNIGEIVVYDNALSNSNRDALTSGLRRRWGV